MRWIYLNKINGMRKILFSILLISFLSCMATKELKGNKVNLLRGAWESKADKNWIISFTPSGYNEYYELEKIEENVNYVQLKESCDESYLTEKSRGDFILIKTEESFCVEIVGLTDSTLSYIETQTGRLHTFTKVKEPNSILE